MKNACSNNALWMVAHAPRAMRLIVVALVAGLAVSLACTPPPRPDDGNTGPAFDDADGFSQRSGLVRVSSFAELVDLPDSHIDIALAWMLIAYEAGLAELADVVDARDSVIELANAAKRRINDYTSDRRKCDIVVETVFEAGFQFDASDPDGKKLENLLLHRMFARRRGYCVSLSLLALAIAYYVDAPLYGVHLPTHFFVRFGTYGDTDARNYEMTRGGVEISDSEYFHRYELSATAVGRGSYLFNLTRREALADVFNNLGSTAVLESRHTVALARYTQGIALNERSPQLWYNRGVVQMRLEKFAEAVSDFRHAVEQDPSNYDALCARGRLYCELGDPATGMADLARAIEIKPAEPLAYTIRGVNRSRLGDHEGAIEDLRAAIDRAPNDPMGYYNLALALLEAEAYVDAATAINNFLELVPNHELAPTMRRHLEALQAAGIIPDDSGDGDGDDRGSEGGDGDSHDSDETPDGD